MPAITHSQRVNESLPDDEERLLDYVARLVRHTTGRRAVQVHIGKLQPYNRRDRHLRAAFSTLKGLTRKFDGGCFQVRSGDLVLILKGASVAEMDHGVLQLRFLFCDDPLLKQEAAGKDPFCTWYDLERDYDALRALALGLLAARSSEPTPNRPAPDAMRPVERQAERPPRPAQPQTYDRPVEAVPRQGLVDLQRLGQAEAVLLKANLRDLIRRQSAAVILTGQPAQPVFTEIYVAIGELGRRILPDVDLMANRWLFQYLTVLLDRRMLRLLPGEDGLNESTIAINLNVASVTDDAFLAFDRDIRLKTQKAVIVEIQALDALADLGRFYRAQAFLRDRGHRVLLDGLSHETFPLLCHPELGCDLYKLRWQTELTGEVGQRALARLRQQVRAVGAAHIVLTHSGDAEAIAFGHDLGIPTFQGRHVDRLLAEAR